MTHSVRHVALVLALVPLGTRIQEAPDAAGTAPAPPRPNVVVVVVDDLGWGDLGDDVAGLPGVKWHRTPHIAAFAAESLVHTRAYAAAPNCAPSRASLQTGRYTPRHGVLTVGSPDRGKPEHRGLATPASTRVLPAQEVTLAELLGPEGYTSCHVGKWHLGPDPRTQGYDANIGGGQAGHPKSYFAPYKNPALEDGPDGESLTTRLTDGAIGWMGAQEGPFLLHLAYFTVHTPLQARPEAVAERRAAGAPAPQYAAMVEAMDTEFGRLMAAIEAKGGERGTIVIFTSDNGGYGPVTNREPLRGFKGTLDEGGVRAALMVRWPGRIAARIDRTPVHHVDLAPTLTELCGAEAEGLAFDGVSLVDRWTRGGDLSQRDLFWHFPCYLQGKSDRFPGWRTTPGSTILAAGRWKLIHFHGDGPPGEPWVELYDLEKDPKETTDLAPSMPERAAELRGRLDAWRRSVGAENAKPG